MTRIMLRVPTYSKEIRKRRNYCLCTQRNGYLVLIVFIRTHVYVFYYVIYISLFGTQLKHDTCGTTCLVFVRVRYTYGIKLFSYSVFKNIGHPLPPLITRITTRDLYVYYVTVIARSLDKDRVTQ